MRLDDVDVRVFDEVGMRALDYVDSRSKGFSDARSASRSADVEAHAAFLSAAKLSPRF